MPFLLVATFIKSPVAFVCIVFYTAYAVIALGAREILSRDGLCCALPYIALLLALLTGAVLAEQLRIVLLDVERRGFFAQGATAGRDQFFGTWELRSSPEFWQKLWQRVRVWGPSPFGYVYLAVTATALALKPDRQLAAVTAANAIAFLSGWLVLSVAYYVHDYYQLPLAIIAFIAFGVSLSRIVLHCQEKLPARHHKKAVIVAYSLAALVLLTQATRFDSLGDGERARVRFWNVIEYALRDEQAFLLVTQGQGAMHDPTPGGLAGTKFHHATADDFAAHCERYLAEFPAVLAQGDSECLTHHRLQAHYYIADAGFTFWGKREAPNPPTAAP